MKKLLCLVLLICCTIIISDGAFISKGYSLSEAYTPSIIQQKELESNNKDESLIFEGYNLNTLSSSEEIRTQIRSDEKINIVIRLNYDYILPKINIDEDASSDEVDSYLSNYRAQVKNIFYANNLTYLSKLDEYDFLEVDVSEYSPFIFASISTEDFELNNYQMMEIISSDIEVDTLYIQKPDEIFDTNMTSAFPAVNLPSNLNSGYAYNGTGVNIGLLEYLGIVDATNVNFLNSNLTVRNVWYYKEHITEHAMRVGSIIGANTGVARGAHIYSVELSGGPSSEVEWLLDNDVNIINNSWGDAYPNGEYASTSAYFDYIVYTSRVTVVCSAGNDGNVSGYVGNPGLGYNVITVGNSYDSGAIYVSSSYDEAFSISKPTLTAPGYSISVPNFPDMQYIDGQWYLINCGTSFSAPIVTGSIALLMQRYPILKMYPEKIISVITAASNPVSGFNDFDTSGLEEKVGSGMFNYIDCSTVYLYNSLLFQISESQQGEYVAERRVYLTAGTNLRISLAWLINSENSTQTNRVTDLDLHFAYDNGNLITTSSSGGNNIEFIDYTITSSGYYRIKIYQYGPINSEGVIYGSYSYST